MYSNSTGSQNTSYGFQSLYNNTTGTNHVAIGYGAANRIVSAGGTTPNTAIGYDALYGGSNT